jgi:hypothetical protein
MNESFGASFGTASRLWPIAAKRDCVLTLDRSQKFKDRGVHLHGALLLNPMAAVGENNSRSSTNGPWPASAMWKRSPFSNTSRCVNSCVLLLSAAAKVTLRVALLAKTPPVGAISAGAAIEPAIPPRTARRLREVRFEP